MVVWGRWGVNWRREAGIGEFAPFAMRRVAPCHTERAGDLVTGRGGLGAARSGRRMRGRGEGGHAGPARTKAMGAVGPCGAAVIERGRTAVRPYDGWRGRAAWG